MFEHLKKITLHGGCFDTETDLELFSGHSLSILYGRNGSGKTTIAKGFRELKKPEPDEASELTVSSEAVISEEFKSAIHVFDEDFVSSQVRITEQGVKTKLLEQVFSYAQGHTDEPSDTSIGNVMRRLLEAFSSFCYCRSFEEMLRMESLQENIPEAQRPYYENFMSRLILNGESHEEESVYALNTITPFFTREEKIRTARSILRFLLYVNRPHLVAYLSDKVAEIEGWSDETLEI